MIVTLIAAGLVFSLVVFVHELGHLLAARWAGVRVHAFSIGLGPVLYRLRRGATEYRLSALPIGGYVRLAGLKLFDRSADDVPADERFSSKSRVARIGIYLAGPAASVVLGLLLLTISFSSNVGIPADGEPRSLRIATVTQSSHAWEAGLRSGDEVLGAETECFLDGGAFADRFALSAGQEVELLVSRGAVERTVRVTAPPDGDLGTFGVVLTPLWLDPHQRTPVAQVAVVEGRRASVADQPRLSSKTAFMESLKVAGEAAAGTKRALAEAISGRADLAGVMGPVGIAWFSGRITDRFGWLSMLWVAGIVSLALAFFNLIPMPPLDGGQATILALEAIAGRDLGYPVRLAISIFGLGVLLALTLVTTFADVSRLLR